MKVGIEPYYRAESILSILIIILITNCYYDSRPATRVRVPTSISPVVHPRRGHLYGELILSTSSRITDYDYYSYYRPDLMLISNTDAALRFGISRYLSIFGGYLTGGPGLGLDLTTDLKKYFDFGFRFAGYRLENRVTYGTRVLVFKRLPSYLYYVGFSYLPAFSKVKYEYNYWIEERWYQGSITDSLYNRAFSLCGGFDYHSLDNFGFIFGFEILPSLETKKVRDDYEAVPYIRNTTVTFARVIFGLYLKF